MDLWVTEWGWNIEEKYTPKQQADYTIKGFSNLRGTGASKITLYSFNIATDAGYGNIHSAVGREVRPVYPAVAAMNRIIADRNYIGNLKLGDEIEAYSYAVEGKPSVTKLWSNSNKTAVFTTSTQLTLYDIFGNATLLTPQDGMVTLPLSGSPCYISGEFDELSTAVPIMTASSNLDNNPDKIWQGKINYYKDEPYLVTKGYTVNMSVQVYNYTDAVAEGTLQLENLPDTWFKSSNDNTVKYSVQPYSSGVVTFSVSPPLLTELGEFTAKVVEVNGKLAAKAYPVNVVADLGVVVGKNKLTLTNSTSKTISGSVKFDPIDGWSTICQNNTFTIEAGKSLDIKYVLSPNSSSTVFGKTKVSGVVTADSGIGNVPFSQELFTVIAKKTSKPLTINGKKDAKWQDINPISINEPSMAKLFGDSGDAAKAWSVDNLSAELHVQWDNSNIYMLVVLKDNVHSQPFEEGGMWQGDSLQLAFDNRNDGVGVYGDNVYELIIGKPDTKEAEIICGYGCSKQGKMEGSEIVVVRDEKGKTTTYEFKMPITALDGMQSKVDGHEIGFSVLINDNDGTSRIGYLEWSSGIGSDKEATYFGSLFLK